MTDIRKFLSDVERIKKHARQNNGGNCDYQRRRAGGLAGADAAAAEAADSRGQRQQHRRRSVDQRGIDWRN